MTKQNRAYLQTFFCHVPLSQTVTQLWQIGSLFSLKVSKFLNYLPIFMAIPGLNDKLKVTFLSIYWMYGTERSLPSIDTARRKVLKLFSLGTQS